MITDQGLKKNKKIKFIIVVFVIATLFLGYNGYEHYKMNQKREDHSMELYNIYVEEYYPTINSFINDPNEAFPANLGSLRDYMKFKLDLINSLNIRDEKFISLVKLDKLTEIINAMPKDTSQAIDDYEKFRSLNNMIYDEYISAYQKDRSYFESMVSITYKFRYLHMYNKDFIYLYNKYVQNIY